MTFPPGQTAWELVRPDPSQVSAGSHSSLVTLPCGQKPVLWKLTLILCVLAVLFPYSAAQCFFKLFGKVSTSQLCKEGPKGGPSPLPGSGSCRESCASRGPGAVVTAEHWRRSQSELGLLGFYSRDFRRILASKLQGVLRLPREGIAF